MVLLGRFPIQCLSGNLGFDSTVLFPIIWGHRCTFEVDTLGLIHPQNPLVRSCIWFLSGSHIHRMCRCPAEKVTIQDAGQKYGRIRESLCFQQAQRCHYSRFLVFGNVLVPPSDFWGGRPLPDRSSLPYISNHSVLLLFQEANPRESKFGYQSNLRVPLELNLSKLQICSLLQILEAQPRCPGYLWGRLPVLPLEVETFSHRLVASMLKSCRLRIQRTLGKSCEFDFLLYR